MKCIERIFCLFIYFFFFVPIEDNQRDPEKENNDCNLNRMNDDRNETKPIERFSFFPSSFFFGEREGGEITRTIKKENVNRVGWIMFLTIKIDENFLPDKFREWV